MSCQSRQQPPQSSVQQVLTIEDAQVVAPNPALPKAVRRAIAEAVEAKWKEMLVEAEEGSNWQLAAIFDWTKSK